MRAGFSRYFTHGKQEQRQPNPCPKPYCPKKQNAAANRRINAAPKRQTANKKTVGGCQNGGRRQRFFIKISLNLFV